MFSDDQKKEIAGIIQTQLGNFNTPPIATHFHNGWDANNLDPSIALTGFPVFIVTDASVAPTDQYDNGKFRFQIDFKSAAPHAYLWAYLVYANATNQQISKWWGVALT